MNDFYFAEVTFKEFHKKKKRIKERSKLVCVMDLRDGTYFVVNENVVKESSEVTLIRPLIKGELEFGIINPKLDINGPHLTYVAC